MRARRGLPLSAAAVTVILIAAFLYVQENPSRPAATDEPTREPAMLAGYTVAYDFVSPSLGWALLEAEPPLFWIFRTTDGASTWKRVYTGIAVPGPISLHFFDATRGFLVVQSIDSVVMRTGDAGLHWQPIVLPGSAQWITFSDPGHGWMLGAGTPSMQTVDLLATADGGATWTRMTLPPKAAWSGNLDRAAVHFRLGGEGWLGANGTDPAVYMTLDSGHTWHLLIINNQRGFSPPKLRQLPSYTTKVNLLPHTGVLALVTDSSGTIRAFSSFDRGQHWRSITPPPSPANFSDLAYVDDKLWWL